MNQEAKNTNPELPEWTVPVTWEMCGNVKVYAATMEEALEIAKDEDGVIPLPDDADYVDSSWRLTDSDPEVVRCLYNNNQPDLEEKK